MHRSHVFARYVGKTIGWERRQSHCGNDAHESRYRENIRRVARHSNHDGN